MSEESTSLLGIVRAIGSFILLVAFAYAVMRWGWRNRGADQVTEQAAVQIDARERAQNGTLA